MTKSEISRLSSHSRYLQELALKICGEHCVGNTLAFLTKKAGLYQIHVLPIFLGTKRITLG